MTLISITSAQFEATHRVAAFQDTVAHICKLEIMPEGGRYPLRASMRQEFFTD